jgi:hypothetical protein
MLLLVYHAISRFVRLVCTFKWKSKFHCEEGPKKPVVCSEAVENHLKEVRGTHLININVRFISKDCGYK